MVAEHPEVSRFGHRDRGLTRRRQAILFVLAGAFDRDINFAHLEPADAKVDFTAYLYNVRKLQPQTLGIPARVLAKPVERESKHSQIGLVEVGDGHGGNFRQAEPVGCKHQRPARDDAAGRIYKNRKNKTELLDTRL